MLTPTQIRISVLCVSFLSGIAGANCVLQTQGWTVPHYSAVQDTRGTLRLVVSCNLADAMKQYTLKISALGGRFDQATGAFVIGAVGRANSVLQMQVQGASPALGGSVLPTVYTGSQDLVFPVNIPAGQWSASGTPSISLSFDLNPYATGNSLP